MHWLMAQGPKGENVRMKGLWDGGAMIAAMDKLYWETHKHRMGGGRPSSKTLRMASGQLVDSEATWEGVIEVEGIRVEGKFEVFDSGGGWTFLFGKPLQTAFSAIHDYKKDIVTIEAKGKRAVLESQQGGPWWTRSEWANEAGVHPAFTGVNSCVNAPARRVHSLEYLEYNGFNKPRDLETIAEDREGEAREELAETTKIEEADAREEQQLEDDKFHMRAYSTGACATPVRGALECITPPCRDGTDDFVAETLNSVIDMAMWWAQVGREETKQNESEYATGGDTDVIKGVQENFNGDWITYTGCNRHRDLADAERKTSMQPAKSEAARKGRRRTTIEEEEDEGDAPSEVRVEVHMQPAEAWLTRANSTGAGATPVRGVHHCIPKSQGDMTDHQVTGVETGAPLEDGEQARSACPRVNSVGVGATPTSKGPSERGEMEDEGREGVGEARVDSTVPQTCAISVGAGATPARGVLTEPVLLTETAADTAHNAAEYEDLYNTDAYATNTEESIFTQATEPFNPRRVAKILEAVTIGPDLTDEQRAEVRDIVVEYADIFALGVSEVFPVAGAVYAPKIPMEKKFGTKVHQRPLTRPQAEYLHEQVEVLQRAGIIRPIHPRDVKCVSPIKLAEKEHDGGGLTHDELKHTLNDECVRAGLPAVYDLPPKPAGVPQPPVAKAQKWRICQNFYELNKLLKVVLFPQGDIRDKQRTLIHFDI
ncbi:hypothetical protein B0H19DRAFT_1255915 [Mycena capillaripes]|nr:hypothetical protein B0H19DRAFT_1255915 [Mycena capillaripes]